MLQPASNQSRILSYPGPAGSFVTPHGTALLPRGDQLNNTA